MSEINIDELCKSELNEFIRINGNNIINDDNYNLDRLASEFVESRTYISSYDQLSSIIDNDKVIACIEFRMSECDYLDLINLSDDSMSDLIWEYIVDNYQNF